MHKSKHTYTHAHTHNILVAPLTDQLKPKKKLNHSRLHANTHMLSLCLFPTHTHTHTHTHKHLIRHPYAGITPFSNPPTLFVLVLQVPSAQAPPPTFSICLRKRSHYTTQGCVCICLRCGCFRACACACVRGCCESVGVWPEMTIFLSEVGLKKTTCKRQTEVNAHIHACCSPSLTSPLCMCEVSVSESCQYQKKYHKKGPWNYI